MDAAQLAHIAHRLPNLEYLILKHAVAATPASPEVGFPSLKQLEVTGSVSEALAQRLRFPVLEEVIISSMLSPMSLISLALSHCAHLRKLQLVRICLSTELADAVVVLAQLEELDAAFCYMTDDLFRRLGRPHADGTWPCPVLRRLHLETIIPQDRETFDGTSLLALVKARRAAGGTVAVLCDVTATWAEDRDYAEEGLQDELQRLLS